MNKQPKILIILNGFAMKLLPFHNGVFDMITNDTCPSEYFEGDLCYNNDTKQIVGAASNQWIPICQIETNVLPIECNVLFGTSFEMIELPVINVQITDKKIKAPAGLNHIKIGFPNDQK